QPTPRFRGMIEALLEALLDALLDAMFDPLPPFTFCCPQAIVDQDEEVSIPNISLLPLDEVPVHVPLRRPPPFAIRKAPSASVESIQPRPPRPAKSEDRKGGEGKTDANLTNFFRDRKSTRLNSSHGSISYAVFCLKKKKKNR